MEGRPGLQRLKFGNFRKTFFKDRDAQRLNQHVDGTLPRTKQIIFDLPIFKSLVVISGVVECLDATRAAQLFEPTYPEHDLPAHEPSERAQEGGVLPISTPKPSCASFARLPLVTVTSLLIRPRRRRHATLLGRSLIGGDILKPDRTATDIADGGEFGRQLATVASNTSG